jgi:hypothetical protein
MKKLLLAAAAVSLACVPLAHAATVTPPATYWKSSLTEPSPSGGADFEITKSSSTQIKVASGNVHFQLKLAGVVDAGVPVNQIGNTFEVQLRYGGINRTITFIFDVVKGKTVSSQSKFILANSALPGGGVLPDDSIEVVRVRCLQGGSGPGAGQNFCSAGLTAK